MNRIPRVLAVLVALLALTSQLMIAPPALAAENPAVPERSGVVAGQTFSVVVPMDARDLPSEVGSAFGPDSSIGSAGSGCLRVSVGRNWYSTVTGGRVYTYWHAISWCYDGTYDVTAVWGDAEWFSNVDPAFDVQTARLSHASWWGASHVSYNTWAQGHIKNCFATLCWANFYPSITVSVYADGTYSWRTAG